MYLAAKVADIILATSHVDSLLFYLIKQPELYL